MTKPIVMAMTAIIFLAGSAFILPTLKIANAQYGATTGGNIEEQLELAKEKISNAQQAGAYGSGTAMLGTNINETVIFIGIIVAIFGGVAAAFFVRSRTAKKATA